MNKNLQTVFSYHEQTKHSQQRYARSLGYMDWATQPNPFRQYNGTDSFELPLALQNTTPPYHLLDSDIPSAPLVLESLSQFLQFSMGIAAWKVSGESSWAVRCNASSGNLHPTEAYIVLPPLLLEQKKQTSVFHYMPQSHALETLASFDTSFWETLPQNSFLVGLSSIAWREVWKYGERAFRYVNLDAGHAWQSLVVSAKMLGWTITRLDTLHDADIEKVLGLHQDKRFHENEVADMLFVISPQQVNSQTSIDILLQDLPLVYEGIANKLSSSMYEWDIIPAIQKATFGLSKTQEIASLPSIQTPKPTREAKEVILTRRSIHVMDLQSSHISKEQFHTLLFGVSSSLDTKENAAHLILFIHKVADYTPGLYILVRNKRDKEELKSQMHAEFLWQEMFFSQLYLLQKRDLQMDSKAISCSQDIASDGAFSLGMLCNFSKQLNEYGAPRYKELYWECGAIGQQLYLDATSMGLSGTGIGCFLDDTVHNLLGLKNNSYQTLYHFTVGRGFVDSRIQTKKAYKERK